MCGQTLLVLRPHAAGATKRLGAWFELFTLVIWLLFKFKLPDKRKQALLRSNLPGIPPVADEVIRRFKVWFIQTFFCAITLEAPIPQKTFSSLKLELLLRIPSYFSTQN